MRELAADAALYETPPKACDPLVDAALDLLSALRSADARAVGSLLEEECILREPLCLAEPMVGAGGRELIEAAGPLALLHVSRLAIAARMAVLEFEGWVEGRGALLVVHFSEYDLAREVLIFAGADAPKATPPPSPTWALTGSP